MCRHYAPGKTRHCLEPVAEIVKDTTRANYCDWFQLGPTGNSAGSGQQADSRHELERLFGKDEACPSTPPGSPRAALDQLFSPGKTKD